MKKGGSFSTVRRRTPRWQDVVRCCTISLHGGRRGQCILRFVNGLILLLLAATLPLRAPARGEPFHDNRSGGDLIEAVEQLLHPRQPTAEEIERRRQEDENRWRLQENALELERMLAEKEASLANAGPTFRISEVTGYLSPMRLGSYLRKACLIDETGKAYMYDMGQGAAAQAIASVNEREFSQAVALAKSLGHVEWRPPVGYCRRWRHMDNVV